MITLYGLHVMRWGQARLPWQHKQGIKTTTDLDAFLCPHGHGATFPTLDDSILEQATMVAWRRTAANSV